MLSPVFQPWVLELPWKMQSVLMTATRGPDDNRHKHIKMANRWIRDKLFFDADPANPFIIKAGDIEPEKILHELQLELEYTTVHYFGHFIHAFEIVGYMHPDKAVGNSAANVYTMLCNEVLHLPPETSWQMQLRLRDVTEH